MRVVLDNNIYLEVKEYGNKDHPVILLISGLGQQIVDWPDSLINLLVSKNYRVITFDNRDIGKSITLGKHSFFRLLWNLFFIICFSIPLYTIQNMADDTSNLLIKLNITKAHIIGWSMGGMIAQRLACTYPHLVASLTLLMTSAGMVYICVLA